MARNPYDIVIKPIVTEKSTMIRDQYAERGKREPLKKYTIEVVPTASKDEIRTAVEALFPETQGHIAKINTLRLRSTTKDPDKGRLVRRFRPGRTRTRKKAIITLRDGVTIPKLEGT